MIASKVTATQVTAPRLRPAQLSRAGAIVAVLAALVAFPLVITNPAITNYGVLTLIFVAAAASWNIFSGYSGYISLGHAVFFGSGAYFTGIATKDWNLSGSAVFALLPLAGLVGAVLAVPFGLVALRVRRHTFVVITIAVFFVFQLMAYNLQSLTGGTSGLLGPTINFSPATFNNPFYYIALIIAVIVVALSFLIRRSRFGLQLRAIRDDEDRAAGLGVKVMPVKLSAFVISAVPTAMVGGLLWYYLGLIDPSSGFDPLFDVAVVLMAFLGGLGTVTGPVLGALLIEPARLYFQQQTTYIYLILYGALFLVVILVLPRGIIPTAAERISGWRARRKGSTGQVAASPAPAGPDAVTDRASEPA
ncbi:MAG TPA: branched-chain amino acid ABC transporter permease [Streptosporangiaceae bacterium]|nr:branched-chain amino acid ABC transporter permease [Streptosporangiaceae bacterium]